MLILEKIGNHEIHQKLFSQILSSIGAIFEEIREPEKMRKNLFAYEEIENDEMTRRAWKYACPS